MMLSFEIDKMRQLLTPAQMEKLSKEFRKSQSLPAKKIRTVAEEPHATYSSSENLINFEDSKSPEPSLSGQRSLTPSDIRLQEV